MAAIYESYMAQAKFLASFPLHRRVHRWSLKMCQLRDDNMCNHEMAYYLMKMGIPAFWNGGAGEVGSEVRQIREDEHEHEDEDESMPSPRPPSCASTELDFSEISDDERM